MLVTQSHSEPLATAEGALTHPPVPLLLYRRGAVPLRALAALEADRRLEVFAPVELTPEWVSFSQRTAGCIVAASDDPLGAFSYALMAGLRGRIVVAMDRRFATDCGDLMSAGAFACVTFPFSREDVGRLVDSLRPHAGSAQVERTLRLLLDPVSRTIRHLDRSARLTQREFALLHCLVSHAGRAVRAEELLATAWGDNPKVAGSRPVLEVYVHQLRKKLAAVGLDGVLRTVRGYGYELTVPTPA